jgi:hypothetical protein
MYWCGVETEYTILLNRAIGSHSGLVRSVAVVHLLVTTVPTALLQTCWTPTQGRPQHVCLTPSSLANLIRRECATLFLSAELYASLSLSLCTYILSNSLAHHLALIYPTAGPSYCVPWIWVSDKQMYETAIHCVGEILLQKLLFIQRVKTFSALYRMWNCITAFTIPWLGTLLEPV